MVSRYRAKYEAFKQNTVKGNYRSFGVLSSSRWTGLKTLHSVNGLIFAEYNKCDSYGD
jgi:hypothetical protein